MRSRILPLFFLAAVSLPCVASTGISTVPLPNAVIQDSYFGVISASGGCAPYTWKLTSGALPVGVKMKVSSSTKNMIFYGKPTMVATYSFSVSATGCDGSTANASRKIAVQAAADHVVDLKWNASTTTDVVGYNIYRGPDGKFWVKVTPTLTASTAYSDSTIADSSTYYYAATAVDVNGKESKKSNIATSVVP